MMIFGGSPTGVIVPPMLAWTVIAISTGTGFISITSHNLQTVSNSAYDIKMIK